MSVVRDVVVVMTTMMMMMMRHAGMVQEDGTVVVASLSFGITVQRIERRDNYYTQMKAT